MKHAYLLYTGYGKTKLCLDKIMQASRKPRTLLISTKNIIESSWSAEIDKWYPNQITYSYITGNVPIKERKQRMETSYDMFGINTDLLDYYIKETCPVKTKRTTKQGMSYTYDTDVLLKRFDLVIFDEVSLFKNSQSERFKNVKKWTHKMPNVMILSATPTPKNIEDIWSQIYLLDGGQRLGASVSAFREKYAIPIPLMNGYNRYEYPQVAIDEVLTQIKDITTSIPEPPAPLFPEPKIKKLLIKPDLETQMLLESFKKDYIVDVQDKTIVAMSKTQLINKINQIANGSVYHKNNTLHMNTIKIRAIKNMLSTITTPVLILYTYVFDKDNLLQLPNARLLQTAQDFQDWNDNKIPIGILSPFSAAHGLNLQHSDCQNVIWFSPIWDTEKWIQTNARVVRRGQKHAVTISILLLKGSYDEHAFDLVQDKFKIQFKNLEKLK
jgi:SNF2 family DNA or RNA helicase